MMACSFCILIRYLRKWAIHCRLWIQRAEAVVGNVILCIIIDISKLKLAAFRLDTIQILIWDVSLCEFIDVWNWLCLYSVIKWFSCIWYMCSNLVIVFCKFPFFLRWSIHIFFWSRKQNEFVILKGAIFRSNSLSTLHKNHRKADKKRNGAEISYTIVDYKRFSAFLFVPMPMSACINSAYHSIYLHLSDR